MSFRKIAACDLSVLFLFRVEESEERWMRVEV